MNRRDRQTQIIERRKKKERIEKVREKRWSKEDEKQMELLLMKAKNILGIL